VPRLGRAERADPTELCTLFWPDRPSALGRNSLRQALVAIKRALSGRANAMSLQSDLEVVRLSAGAGTIDVHAFRHGVQGNRDSMIAAANAYRGELLAGVEVPDDVEQFVTSMGGASTIKPRHSLSV